MHTHDLRAAAHVPGGDKELGVVPEIQSGWIRVVRQNQRIIRCDVYVYLLASQTEFPVGTRMEFPVRTGGPCWQKSSSSKRPALAGRARVPAGRRGTLR
jgi:hypothetical protein